MTTKEELEKDKEELEKKVDILELDKKFDNFEKRLMSSIEKTIKDSRHKLRSYIHIELNKQMINAVEKLSKEKNNNINKKKYYSLNPIIPKITSKQITILTGIVFFVLCLSFGIDTPPDWLLRFFL